MSCCWCFELTISRPVKKKKDKYIGSIKHIWVDWWPIMQWLFAYLCVGFLCGATSNSQIYQSPLQDGIHAIYNVLVCFLLNWPIPIKMPCSKIADGFLGFIFYLRSCLWHWNKSLKIHICPCSNVKRLLKSLQLIHSQVFFILRIEQDDWKAYNVLQNNRI
jgi:hypothetical protein